MAPSSFGTLLRWQVRMYYLAVPSFLYVSICAAMAQLHRGAPTASAFSPAAGGGGGGGGGGGHAVEVRPAGPSRRRRSREIAPPVVEERVVLEKPSGRRPTPDACPRRAPSSRRTADLVRRVWPHRFGRDTDSCVRLMEELAMLPRERAYLIDHYLGEPTLALALAPTLTRTLTLSNPHPQQARSS